MENHFGVVAMLAIASAVSGIFIFLAQTLGPKKPNPAKNMPFECGMTPFSQPVGRQVVRFYLAAMLFVVFDIELIFLFPWAVVLRSMGWPAFWPMMVFLFIFEIGFLYAWRKGAFQWH